jgi:hypothetical protein
MPEVRKAWFQDSDESGERIRKPPRKGGKTGGLERIIS